MLIYITYASVYIIIFLSELWDKLAGQKLQVVVRDSKVELVQFFTFLPKVILVQFFMILPLVRNT
jgi:hypothetical protein